MGSILLKKYIPEDVIQEVKRHCDIVEVISDHVPLQKAGRNYKGLCPFHAEKTPSFIVNPERGIFYCFGCNTGGDVFGFLMKKENLSFAEAISALAERAGLASFLRRTLSDGIQPSEGRSEKFFAIHEATARFFQRNLLESPLGEKARRYLKARRIQPSIAEKFLLGYAPPSADPLIQFLNGQGFSPEVAKEVGLLREAEPGGRLYCWLWDRLTFPLFNSSGKGVGFGGRILDRTTKYPKYINSPESPIYKKGSHLYGLNLAKEAIRREGGALVVEGYFDLITLVQAGIEHVVAPLGTSLTSEHMRLLQRYTSRVIMVFDGDAAGLSAVERLAAPFLDSGLRGFVLALPGGEDPDSYLWKEGKEAFLAHLRGAVPYLEYLMDQTMAHQDCSRIEGRVECVNKLLPLVARIPNQVERMGYLSLMAEKTGTSEAALLAELRKLSGASLAPGNRSSTRTHPADLPQGGVSPSLSASTRATIRSPAHGPQPAQPDPRELLFKPDRRHYAERELLQLILQDGRTLGELRETLAPESFQNGDFREIVRVLFGLWQEGLEEVGPRALAALSDERQKAVVSQLLIERKEYEEVDKDKLIRDCIDAIESHELESKCKQALKEERYEEFQKLQRRRLELARQANT